MALPVTFDHCVVHVSDWDRSNAFYRDVLGAELIRRAQGWAYRFGAAQLNLHGPGVRPRWHACPCNPETATCASNGVDPSPRPSRTSIAVGSRSTPGRCNVS